MDLEVIDASGQRGDQVLETLKQKLEQVGTSDKIVRVRVTNVSPETLKTLPAAQLSELKERAFALDVRFEKTVTDVCGKIVNLLGQSR